MSNTITRVPWTEEEDEVIRRVYPHEGEKGCARIFGSSRQLGAIRYRAHRLGVRVIKRKPGGVPWSRKFKPTNRHAIQHMATSGDWGLPHLKRNREQLRGLR